MKSIVEFVNKYKPVKLTPNEEPAFADKSVIEYLTNIYVDVHIITEQNHSALSVIDKFIRMLRDMNIPNEKTDKQSHDEKYQSFTIHRMSKLIDIYNSTYHSCIKCTPREMFNDANKEKEYIFKQLKRRELQEGIKLEFKDRFIC